MVNLYAVTFEMNRALKIKFSRVVSSYLYISLSVAVWFGLWLRTGTLDSILENLLPTLPDSNCRFLQAFKVCS